MTSTENPRDTREWPLRWLNAFVMPVAAFLAGFSESFSAGLLGAGLVGTVGGGVLAVLFIARLRRMREGLSPLERLQIQLGYPDLDEAQPRFVGMQAASGALIATMWFCLARGVISLVR